LTETGIMNADRVQRRAATLLLVTSALWLHEWFAAILVVGWVAWLVLHERLEGDLGKAIVRVWQRAWPPSTLVLIPLLAANALLYWAFAPIPGNLVPIALNLLGLTMIVGGWCARRVPRDWLRQAPVAPVGAREPLGRKA
jgi:hypothetical protein